MSKPRVLALLLLCPTALACAADDLAALDESSSSDDAGASDEGNALPGDLELDANASETRDLHRSRIAVSNASTCAIVPDGTVRCWGANWEGQLGDGAGESSATPVVVAGLTDVVAIDAGTAHVIALRSNGTVWRWGTRHGDIDGGGTPWDATPQQVPGLSDIVSIGSAWASDCAVRADGRAFCWGHGWLGDGDGLKMSDSPVQVSSIDTAVATNGHCVLLANGIVKCWGENDHGEVGDGTLIDRTTPVSVPGIGTAVAIACTGRTRHAVLADGTIRSWGWNHGGALGNGIASDVLSHSTTPVQVVGITDAGNVEGGHTDGRPFACAVLRDGTLSCWGGNIDGVLAIGSEDLLDHPTPQTVAGLDSVVAFDGYRNGACAALSDGSMRCWGDNVAGRIGDGTEIDSFTPLEVLGLSGASDGPRVATGMYHSCGLRSDGTVKCWGDNAEGQIGDGTLVDRNSATLVAGLAGAIDVVAGGDHSCALVDDGTARCWGRNATGQLGDDGASGIRSSTPVVVQNLGDATQLAASEENTCALRSNGTAVCWGGNSYGQIGDGTYTASDVPVAVSGLTNAVAIDASRYHVCALGSGGQVKCWGSNVYGQLGNGSSGNGAKSNVPVTVRTGGLLNPPLNGVVAISAGSFHGCAVIAGGAVRCWGLGNSGQLGQGAWSSSNYPVTVSGVSTGIDVAAGGDSSCALRSNGSARCWGGNDWGELGNGDEGDDTNTAVSVGMNPIWLSNAIAIDSGYDHSCVAKGNGSIWCWGRNQQGQLGNGSNFDSDLPVGVASFP
ncbi:MAG TPA: hypothetical protein VG755_38185 [Nannocystaceae bacterium]|nr:hypothetical protein [Nannocystaceae bacterium]